MGRYLDHGCGRSPVAHDRLGHGAGAGVKFGDVKILATQSISLDISVARSITEFCAPRIVAYGSHDAQFIVIEGRSGRRWASGTARRRSSAAPRPGALPALAPAA